MKCMSMMCAMSIALAVLPLGCRGGRDATEKKHEFRAASELSGEFETVFYARPQLLLPNLSSHANLQEPEASNLRYPFAYLKSALDHLGTGSYASLLEGSGAVFVGAKDFQPPAGLGEVHSQRCYIVVLEKGNKFDLRKRFSSAPVATVAGVPIWNWNAKLGEFGENDPRASSLYVSQIGESYVLVSNDFQDLQKLASRLSVSGAGSQESSGIPDWATLSQYEEWGYRKYRHTGTISRDAAGLTDITPSSDTLVFFVNSDKRTGVLRLTASDKSAADQINAGMTAAKIAWLPLKPSGARTWETTIPFSGDEASADRTFIVAGLFGFAVYL